MILFFILYNTRPHEHCAFKNDDDDDDDDDADDDNDVIDDDDDDGNDDCVGSGGVEVTPIRGKNQRQKRHSKSSRDQ